MASLTSRFPPKKRPENRTKMFTDSGVQTDGGQLNQEVSLYAHLHGILHSNESNSGQIRRFHVAMRKFEDKFSDEPHQDAEEKVEFGVQTDPDECSVHIGTQVDEDLNFEAEPTDDFLSEHTDVPLNDAEESLEETLDSQSDQFRVELNSVDSEKSAGRLMRSKKVGKTQVVMKRKIYPAKPPVKKSAKNQPISVSNFDEDLTEPTKAKRRRMDTAEIQSDSEVAKVNHQSTATVKNAKRVGIAAKNSQNIDVTKKNSLMCELCEETFKLPGNLRKHKKDIHSQMEYRCDQCGKVFPFASHLQKHSRVHSNAKFNCVECGKSYKHPQTLIEHHTVKHSEENGRKFRCLEFGCGKSFADVRILQAHYKTHLTTIITCEECGDKFTNPRCFGLHLKRKHPAEEDLVWECPDPNCQQRFALKTFLTQHSLVHSTDYHQCDKCESSFKHPHNLKLHQKQVHLQRRLPKLHCGQCELTFTQPKKLQRHIKQKHPESDSD